MLNLNLSELDAEDEDDDEELLEIPPYAPAEAELSWAVDMAAAFQAGSPCRLLALQARTTADAKVHELPLVSYASAIILNHSGTAPAL